MLIQSESLDDLIYFISTPITLNCQKLSTNAIAWTKKILDFSLTTLRRGQATHGGFYDRSLSLAHSVIRRRTPCHQHWNCVRQSIGLAWKLTKMKANHVLNPKQGSSDVGGEELIFCFYIKIKNLLLKYKSDRNKGNYTLCVSHRYF